METLSYEYQKKENDLLKNKDWGKAATEVSTTMTRFFSNGL